MSQRRPLIATYIEASRPFGVLYTGMTADLYRRAAEHHEGRFPGFARDHGCSTLVWYQPFDLVVTAIRREKALKRWNRAWKMQLIEQRNPDWVDLYPWLSGQADDPRLPEPAPDMAAFERRLKDGD